MLCYGSHGKLICTDAGGGAEKEVPCLVLEARVNTADWMFPQSYLHLAGNAGPTARKEAVAAGADLWEPPEEIQDVAPVQSKPWEQ